MKRTNRTKTRAKTGAKTGAKPRAKPKRTKPRPASARQSLEQTSEGDAIDALVVAGARALGIALDPSWQASVTFNLRLILSHAAKIDGFPLPDDAEPAAIFHA